jgi:hypothetical protein
LVEFLFREAEADSPFVYRWDLFWKYKKLNHPGLKDQLEPRMDESRPEAVRKLAVDIANTCDGAGLTGKLVDIVLNNKEPLSLRISAASWISKLLCPGEGTPSPSGAHAKRRQGQATTPGVRSVGCLAAPRGLARDP